MLSERLRLTAASSGFSKLRIMFLPYWPAVAHDTIMMIKESHITPRFATCPDMRTKTTQVSGQRSASLLQPGRITLLMAAACITLTGLSAASVRVADEQRVAQPEPRCITLARFDGGDIGARVPDGWKPLTFDSDGGIKPSEYRVVEKDGQIVLRGRTLSGASALFREIEVDPQEYPYIAWRWRVEQSFPRGDGTTKGGDDYPARLYVAFKYDSSRVGWWTRMKFRMARGRSEYGGYPPLWALNYVWANTLKQNTWTPNRWQERSKMVAVRSGEEGVGEWHWEVRNYVEDFREIVGEEPTPVKFIAVMIDGDNTNTDGEAYFGPIQLWSELPARFQGRVPAPPRRYGTEGSSRDGPGRGRRTALGASTGPAAPGPGGSDVREPLFYRPDRAPVPAGLLRPSLERLLFLSRR